MIHLTTPLTKQTTASLRAGDEVLLSGTILTGRDAAHKRLYNLLMDGKELPVDLRNQIIYYVGPTPPPPGRVAGSAGPTTSSRMDPYTPLLLERTGLCGMIGKGDRSSAVVDSIKKNSAVYFAALGGGGALIAQCIINSSIVAYEDLGPEAIYEFTVKDMPLIVAIDMVGNNCYAGRVPLFNYSH